MDTNIIDQYITGNLSGDALKDFQNKLSHDASLREEVEHKKRVVAGLSKIYKENLKNRFKEFENENIQSSPLSVEKKSARTISMRRMLSIAAAILLLAVASFLIFQNINSGASNEQLFAKNLDTTNIPGLENQKRNNGGQFSELSDKWGDAIISYEKKNYKEALNEFEQIREDEIEPKNKSKFQFLKTILLIHNNQYENAWTTLNQINVTENDAAEMELNWYKALLTLKLEKPKEEIRQAFQAVVNDSIIKTRKEQAQTILDKLD